MEITVYYFEKLLNKLNVDINLSSNFFLLLIANGVSNFLQFIATTVIIKFYPPETFGIYSLYISITLTISLIVNSGLLYSLIKVVSKSHNETDDSNARAIVITTSILEGLLLLITIIITYLFKPNLIRWLNLQPDQAYIIELSLITASLITITELIKAVIQSTNTRLLIRYSFYHSLIRILTLTIILVFRRADVLWLVLWMYIVPLGTLSIIFSKYVKPLFNTQMITRTKIVESLRFVVNYSKWMAISSFLYPQLSIIVIYLIAHSTSPQSVGLFYAGLTFTSIFGLLNITLRQLFLPTVNKFNTNFEVINYYKQLKKFAPIYLLISAGLLMVFSILCYYIFGLKYRESLPIFIITGSATAIVVFFGQLNLLSHTFSKPKINALQVLTQTALLTIGGVFIINTFSNILIPLSILYAGVLLLGEMASSVYIIRKIKSLPTNELKAI